MSDGETRGVITYAEANVVQRQLRRLVATGPMAKFGAPLYDRIDTPVFRLTRGRHTLSSLVTGLPVVFLTTVGARSGQRRTSPVLGFPTEGGLAVIASNYGRPAHPAWCHNLRANPAGEVVVNGVRSRFRAVEVEGERRDQIWSEALSIYPGWSSYERRATSRRIPVFVLEAQ